MDGSTQRTEEQTRGTRCFTDKERAFGRGVLLTFDVLADCSLDVILGQDNLDGADASLRPACAMLDVIADTVTASLSLRAMVDRDTGRQPTLRYESRNVGRRGIH